MAIALGQLQGVSISDPARAEIPARADLCKSCRIPSIETAIRSWHPQFLRLADKTKAPIKELERQARLHLPRIPIQLIDRELMPAALARAVEERVRNLHKDNELYAEGCLSKEIGARASELLLVKDDKVQIRFEGGGSISAHIGPVSDANANFIEKRLHYLQATRSDAVARFGLYLEQAESPICYLSFTPCDREYIRIALSLSLERPIKFNEILILARVYGVGRLPRNAISMIVGYACRALKNDERRFVVTAVNPFLGYDGTSMAASGFSPFALSPVAYSYTDEGTYVPRRHKGSVNVANCVAPPNMLLVRGMDRYSRRAVKTISSLYTITDQLHAEADMTPDGKISRTKIKIPNLEEVRLELERAWGNITRYHRTSWSENDPISKGQCGVSSAYLAKNFEKQDVPVMFCEGDVSFPGGVPPIRHHCWLRLTSPDNSPDQDIIIDMTADQSGYEHSVICDRYGKLVAQGIHYEQRSEIRPKEVSSDSLISRLAKLENRLKDLAEQSD